MRVKVVFYVEKEIKLPYHLNYALSSFWYQCISKADHKLSTWLHEEGISFRDRSYKPLQFSSPFFERRKNEREGMVVQRKMMLQVGSMMPEIIHRLIEGLWKLRYFHFMDQFIPLAGVEIVEPIPFTNTMNYRALSPIVVPVAEKNRLHYCHPLESRFYDSLRLSIRNWYHIYWKESLAAEEEIHLSLLNPDRFQMKRGAVLTRYKGKNIKGYQVPLQVVAPPQVQQVIYETGLGSYGSQGFGMVDVTHVDGSHPKG